MIDRAVQRGGGQNLASHFMKEWENEQITIAEIKGAIAQDLHGAFKEWWLESKATNADQYLFTVAINPDPKQPAWTRDQYHEFIARMEQNLGLEGQPRAIVFHTKFGREHAHVTWSRTYAEKTIQNGQVITKFKAKQMDFYKDRIMRTAINYAKDIGYQLPEGYTSWQNEQFADLDQQLTQADKAAERTTGITTAQHASILTAVWQQTDNARSFKAALEEAGYILARGDRRTYVAVDRYGKVHSLSRRIDGARSKDIIARLGNTFAIDPKFAKLNPALKLLPTVIGAQKTAAKRKAALTEKTKTQFNEVSDEANFDLKNAQHKRREKLISEQQEQNAPHPETYRDIELERLETTLDKIDKAERDALGEFLTRRQREQARSGGDDFGHYLSGSALHTARSAVKAISQFDERHPKTAPFLKDIKATYSEIGKLEGRQKFAGELRRNLYTEFHNAFGPRRASSAYERYQKDIERFGIEPTTRLLRERPNRYGRLPGWELATFLRSKKRTAALIALEKATKYGRQSFYLERKIALEVGRLPELQEHLAILKTQQKDWQQTPAEGRLFLQYLLAEAANRLSSDDFTLLTASEKYQVNEARRLMRDEKIKKWTKDRLAATKHPQGHKPIPPLHPHDDDRVDLREISETEMRRYLNRHFRALRTRHDDELDKLDAAYASETKRILAHRTGGFGRTLGALAALTGLRGSLEKHRARIDQHREKDFRTERIEMKQRHDDEDKPLAQQYRALRRREAQDRKFNRPKTNHLEDLVDNDHHQERDHTQNTKRHPHARPRGYDQTRDTHTGEDS